MIGTPYPLAGKAIRPAYEAKAQRYSRALKSFFFCPRPPSPGAFRNCEIGYEISLFRVQIRGVSMRCDTNCDARLRHNANRSGRLALHASQLRKARSEGLAMPNRYRNGDGYAAMHRRFMATPQAFRDRWAYRNPYPGNRLRMPDRRVWGNARVCIPRNRIDMPVRNRRR